MNQFYVPDDQKTVERCHESRDQRKSITIAGVDAADGNVKLYTGVVQSVEDHGPASPLGRRWRVTILDSS